MKASRFSALVGALVLAVGACGVAETTDDTSTTTSEPPTTTTSTQPATTTTTSTTIPGEVIDFGPQEGDVLMVIGVRYDDVLNLRAGPGVDQEIVDTIAPDFMNIVARGETRQIPDAFWVAVTADGTDGWVSMSFVGYEGVTDDLTSRVVEDLGGSPMAGSMVELGLLVSATLVSDEPPSEVVLTVDQTVGDLGEVTFDIIGLGDDAVRGYRAHVFGEPSADGFSLKAVEVTAICGRGVTSDGLCS